VSNGKSEWTGARKTVKLLPKLSDISDYLAEDGLMSLNKNGSWPSWDPTRFDTTSDSDNGILWLIYWFYLHEPLLEVEHLNHFIDTLANIRHKEVLGLYYRNPNRKNYINSHDNYTAIMAGCILFSNYNIAEQVTRHCILNDENPGKIEWDNFSRNKPVGIHMPHNWVVYRIAAGQRASRLSTLWYIAYLLVASNKHKPLRNDSEMCLNWLRIKAIEKREYLIPFKWLYKLAMKLYIKKAKPAEAFSRFFQEGHPCHVRY